MSDHIRSGGRLLKTDKRFRDLKLAQQEIIDAWLFEEYRNIMATTGQIPGAAYNEKIVSATMVRIAEAQIWIPRKEVLAHLRDRKSHYRRRIHCSAPA